MQWFLVLVVQFLFMCVSEQSVFQKRQCVFQVSHTNHGYTDAGNVSGSVQLCENTNCCVGIYLIINGQLKVDTLACDTVGRFCPNATCNAHPVLKNRFLICTCSTDLCNSNITWVPEAEQPSHTHFDSAAETMKTASVVMMILLVFCLVIIAIRWSFCKDKKKDPQSSCHEYSIQPPHSCQTKALENYITGTELQQVLARGHFATVFQGKYKGSVVAVKMYLASWRHIFTTEKEIYELPLMRHNGIAQFLGTEWKPDDNSWLIVLQHAKYGSLHSFLCKHTTSWMQSLTLCHSLSEGLSYLHSDIRKHDVHKPPVAHRDLCSSNVLVKADGTCALCDFGCSTILNLRSGHRLWQHHAKNMNGHVQFGTLHYMSPEILEGSANLSSSSFLMHGDIYSLGLVLWEIWMRCTDLFEGGIVPHHLLPYELELEANVTLERLVFYVSELNKRPSIPGSWESLPQGSSMKELLTDCWDRDTDARLSAACVVNRLVSLQTSSSA